MTILKYLLETKVCTTAELLAFKKQYPQDYNELIEMAREQAANLGITIEQN